MSVSARRDVVTRSLEDTTGQRCVDLIRRAGGDWGFVECRRDPEDAHGWRRCGKVSGGHISEAGALAAARGAVSWLVAEGMT